MELISVRVKPEIAERLKSLADIMKRSSSFVAAAAIEEYLDLHEWQIKAIQEGINAIDRGEYQDFKDFKKEFYANNPEYISKK